VVVTRMRRFVMLLCALAVVVAGCTSGGDAAEPPPEAEGSSGSEGGGEGEAPAPAPNGDQFAAVLAQVEGLPADQRRVRLAELASEEEEEATLYTSNGDARVIAEAFSEAFDVQIFVYRETPEGIADRLRIDAGAAFPGADIIDTDMTQLLALNQEGLLFSYDSPAHQGMPAEALFEGWTADRFAALVTPQNIDVLPPAQRPADFAQLADPRFDGQLLVEPGAYDWYMTLTTWFLNNGMSQDQVNQMWGGIATNAVLVEGDRARVDFLALGQFQLATGTASWVVDNRVLDGAPLTWDPPLAPTVLRPNGAAIPRAADAPATALLWYEWLLTDGQALLLETQQIPAREEFRVSDTLEGLQTLVVNGQQLLAEGPDWQRRWTELLANSEIGPQGDGL
jgi:iron(III) transport system substrate-binding protein